MSAPDAHLLSDLLAYVGESPSPYHAAANAARRLTDAGFVEVEERSALPGGPGRFVLRRSGALVAWVQGPAHDAATGFTMVGAHTDSPNLRVKPNPDTGRAGYRQIGVEVYGGVLLNSWLDRDLGVSGRLVVRDGDDLTNHLVRIDQPWLRVSQLAIHLDRGINDDGLKLNRQQHLSPMWGLGGEGDFLERVAGEAGVDAGAIMGADLMLHDLCAPQVIGADGEFVAMARIDNLLSCHAAVQALLAVADNPGLRRSLIALFDHEEVGSVSASGAASPLLSGTIERLTGGGENRYVSMADSLLISADGAHATHPNYVERHEPQHHIALNAGPVLKHNANARYATDADSAARVRLAAERAGVELQEFVNRTDMACGSTIGPISAAELGVATVDIGCAQLSMHSAREVCGSADPAAFVALLSEVMG